jgi:MarR family transcriptional regulator, organic hydroperoxide resistance regulator
LTKQNHFVENASTRMSQIAAAAARLMEFYPRIFFACHTRHVHDPQTQRRLSRHQASVLDHLDEIDPMTLNDLARHMGVTAGTMSLTIDRLERKGYVTRLRDTSDRRRVHLRLTAAGVRVREANSVLDPARVEALVSLLADDEREAALRGLALLARAADDQMARYATQRREKEAL